MRVSGLRKQLSGSRALNLSGRGPGVLENRKQGAQAGYWDGVIGGWG